MLASPDSALAAVLLQKDVSDKKPKTRLGIDNGEPVSIAWIGFNEETPHAAVQAETLQPQLSAEAVQASVQATREVQQQISESAQAISESVLDRLNSVAELAAKLEDAKSKAEQVKLAKQQQEEQRPQPAPQPAEPVKEAIQDDRESDATSPVRVRTSNLGKVLAREGMRIQTFRPQFDATTKMHELRARNGSVTAIIRFGKDGSVISASIKQGTESGASAIDEPILDCVYRWRAAGKDIDNLPNTAGAFIETQIQILF
ncbi:MAG: hypothetical protein Phyf2KO_01790 [Phycisphaerales bacterium]